MNILVFCTFPIKTPSHGGQLRVRNIVDTYRADGHQVEVIGVLGSENYQIEEGFLPYPGVDRLAKVIPNPFLMEDYAIGNLFANDSSCYKRLVSKIHNIPDVIQVEHPWLFAVARKYANGHAPNARIIYSAHNVEWQLKQEILSCFVDADSAHLNSDLIKEVELNAILGSDAIVCVSESDADWLRMHTNKPVVMAPNGVNAWEMNDMARKEASVISKGYSYALYCASAHPPNVTGFFTMFGGGFGSLKPDEKLIVAGDAGWAIASDIRVHQSSKLAEKVVVAGKVSQQCLGGLLEGAHCIVLPITQGGGTNLKTAEALWAGKHIVATTVAMRGFERFIGGQGVNISDDPVEFKRMLRRVMSLDPLFLTKEEVDDRRSVLWEFCLKPMKRLINKMNAESVV